MTTGIPKLSIQTCTALDLPEIGPDSKSVIVKDSVDPAALNGNAGVPYYLLLDSLLELLCTFYERDPNLRKELFLSIRNRLYQLQFLDRMPDIWELRSIRSKFRSAFNFLVTDAKRNLPRVPGISLTPTLGPAQDFALHSPDEPNCSRGRYEYDFEEIAEIAQGGFGTVCKAKKRVDGCLYAVKKIPFKYRNQQELKQMLREVELLAKLHHPNVVAYKTAWIENMPIVTVCEEPTTVDSLQSTVIMPSSSSCNGANSFGHTVFVDNSEEIVVLNHLVQRCSSMIEEQGCDSLDVDQEEEGRCISLQESSTRELEFVVVGECRQVRQNSRSDGDFEVIQEPLPERRQRRKSSKRSVSMDMVAAREHAFQLLKASDIGGILFIQMELCSGNLAEWLERRNYRLMVDKESGNSTVDMQEALTIFRQILKAVQYVHSQELIHRDLKVLGLPSRTAAAMALQVPPFNNRNDKWPSYLIRVEAFFEGNLIKEDAKKHALLVSALGSRTVEVLCGVCARKRVNELTSEEAVSYLTDFYAPETNEIAESFKFLTRNQQQGESAREYILQLKRQAEKCTFSNMLSCMLRDRLVCGVSSTNIQKVLLSHSKLTLSAAVNIVFAAETATQKVHGMKQRAQSTLAMLNKLIGQGKSQFPNSKRDNRL